MKFKFKTSFLLLGIIGFALTASAQSLPQSSITSIINAYRFYKDIGNISIKVPTVVEIPFADDFIERFDFAVLDKTANSFEPYFFKQETLVNKIPMSVSTLPNTNSANLMNDNNVYTYADFPLPEDTQGNVQITLNIPQVSSIPITSSSITVLLDNNVALPTSVEIRALVDGQNRIVVARQRMDQQTIHFPQTTSNKWTIVFFFGQPLRISELRLNQDNVVRSNTRAVRFLAQPNHSYRIYFDSDRSVKVPVEEAGDLASTKEVLNFSSVLSQNNPNYIIADVDGDSVPDISDNCVSLANSDQEDVNFNGRGDLCDDFDFDGIINAKDNCPNNPNRDQRDEDSDNIGDICDGVESRITEQHKWIPWVGIGFAVVVLVVLFVLMAKSTFVTKQYGQKK